MLAVLNFFGHAVVASWMERDARFVLGAMLPDFASMCATRIQGIDCSTIEEGVRFHHRTDVVFHAQPWFALRHRRLTRRLLERGVRRGPALGAGHVGIEIALDAVLAANRHDGGTFAGALEAASEPPQWRFTDDTAMPRFGMLVARLGSAADSADAEVVAERVRRTLARRPLLALDADEVPRLRALLAADLEEIASSYDELLASLRAALL